MYSHHTLVQMTCAKMCFFCSIWRLPTWTTRCSPLTLQPCPRVALACQPHLPSRHSEKHKDPIRLWLRSTPTFFSYMLTSVLDALLSCSLPLTPKPWPTLLSRANANSVSLGTGRRKRMTHAEHSGLLTCIWMIWLLYIWFMCVLVYVGYQLTTCWCWFQSFSAF